MRILDLTLILKLHKLMGLRSPNVLGCLISGMVTNMVLLHALGRTCPHKKHLTTLSRYTNIKTRKWKRTLREIRVRSRTKTLRLKSTMKSASMVTCPS